MTSTTAPAPTAPAPTAAPAPKYEFDGEFQKKIAAMVTRDTLFMQRTDGLIQPQYLERESHAALVNVAVKYFGRFKKIPADATIYKMLIADEIKAKTMQRETAKQALLSLAELFTADISDRDYVIDQVATFARHQAVMQAFSEGIPLLDTKNFDSIESKMKKALMVGAHVDVGSYDYGEMLETRTHERLEKAAGRIAPTGITTGYPLMDKELYHNGWGRRELSVIMGGAKAGKTTALINFSINAVAAGYNVLYVTLEVASKIISERCDANISDIAVFELGGRVHEVKEKVAAFMKNAGAMPGTGRFIVQEFPTGAATVSDLRRLNDRYKARGIKFDMIVVDYADLMQPERHTDNAIENSKSVYVGLRGFAMEEDAAVVTATQTNRKGSDAAVAKATDVADDFNKIRIADIVISLNKTDEERALGQCRLFFAACRNQAGGFSIRVEQNLDRMRFITKILGIE